MSKLVVTEPASGYATDSAEAAARLMRETNDLNLPVVDSEDRLVGLFTIDDAVEVIEAADTEDVARQAGAAPCMAASVWQIARYRTLWLSLLLVAATFTVGVTRAFEATSEQVASLALFPMLIGAGGNAGAQAATACVRALAGGEVRGPDLLKVIWRECRVGLVLGVCPTHRSTLSNLAQPPSGHTISAGTGRRGGSDRRSRRGPNSSPVRPSSSGSEGMRDVPTGATMPNPSRSLLQHCAPGRSDGCSTACGRSRLPNPGPVQCLKVGAGTAQKRRSGAGASVYFQDLAGRGLLSSVECLPLREGLGMFAEPVTLGRGECLIGCSQVVRGFFAFQIGLGERALPHVLTWLQLLDDPHRILLVVPRPGHALLPGPVDLAEVRVLRHGAAGVLLPVTELQPKLQQANASVAAQPPLRVSLASRGGPGHLQFLPLHGDSPIGIPEERSGERLAPLLLAEPLGRLL
ncbi:magnesium transporter [Streptomyces sp. B15]|uniref:magnesium transporter n=1 Tax=Streptomyces sp. B15 TaxID=1537797 RepID=UPI0027DC3D40|nr:magnesium transporter [Streptomyces sp. B15]